MKIKHSDRNRKERKSKTLEASVFKCGLCGREITSRGKDHGNVFYGYFDRRQKKQTWHLDTPIFLHSVCYGKILWKDDIDRGLMRASDEFRDFYGHLLKQVGTSALNASRRNVSRFRKSHS